MTNTREQDSRVDELRQRLRSLGYLDAGVDRFILAPARQARGTASIALLASARIGLLAALLLGPAAAVGLNGRVAGLVTGPRDALVLAVYMGVLFGAAVTLASLSASLLVFWLARHRGSVVASRASALSLAAGALVTILCLVYLTLWWQTANAGLGWSAPVWTGFALAVAVAISLLLGHAVAVTSSALIVAAMTVAGAGTSDSARVPRSSWRMSLAAGVPAFAGAATLLVLSAPAATEATRDAPAMVVVSSGLHVRVFAIDGFDPRVFEELSSAGRIPALSRALQSTHARLHAAEGADSREARDPARAWTTVATGQPPDIHGVHGLEARRVAGVQGRVSAATPSALGVALRAATDLVRLTRPTTASGAERRVKTFWEVARDAGLRTAVVNWWATWPANGDDDVLLTDRATLRLEHGGELDAEIAPAALYPELRSRWPDVTARARELADATLGSAIDDREIRSVLQRSAELDAIQLQLAGDVPGLQADLVAVYLPGLDIAQHALLGTTGGRVPSASTVAARLEAVRRYYVALDRLLAPMLKPDPSELLFLITAPGRVTTGGEALLAVHGSSAVTAEMSDSVQGRMTDIAPTILYALGLPLSRELAGTVLTSLFTDDFVARYPVRHVATYGERSGRRPAVRTGRPLDQEMIERLRSLGYVR